MLYRANHQARVFEQALRKAQIPYKVSGGQSFFDRAEIKDLCAWLRLLVNNDDDPAFLRAVTTPKRGIGHQTLASLGEFASQYKLSLFEALFADVAGHRAASAARDRQPARVRPLRERPGVPRPPHHRRRGRAGASCSSWLKDIDYEKHLYDGEDSEKVAAARWTNVLEFCDWMAQRCGGEIEDDGGATVETEKKSLLEVAQTISLIIS